MSEKLKIEKLKSRMESFKALTSSEYGLISKKWAMKNILGIDSRNEARKFKIDSIYGEDNT